MSDTFTYTISGGSGADTVAITTNVAHVLNLASVEVVTGNNTAFDTVTFIAAGTSTLTDIDYIYGSTGADTLTAVGNQTAATNANGGQVSTWLLSAGDGNDVINFGMGSGASYSVGTSMTASIYGGAGNDTITVSDASGNQTVTSRLTEYIVGGAGVDTITLHTTSATTIATHGTGWTVVDVVRINLSTDLTGTTTTGDTISNFNTATDVIDFTGVTLLSAGGASLSLVSAATAGDNFNTSGLYISTSGALLADLTAGGNENAVYIDVTTVVSTSNVTFNNTTGLATAATYITTNIGRSGTVVGEKAIIAVHDTSNTNTAFFYYQETVTTGIQAGELQLIGVVNGYMSTTNLR